MDKIRQAQKGVLVWMMFWGTTTTTTTSGVLRVLSQASPSFQSWAIGYWNWLVKCTQTCCCLFGPGIRPQSLSPKVHFIDRLSHGNHCIHWSIAAGEVCGNCLTFSCLHMFAGPLSKMVAVCLGRHINALHLLLHGQAFFLAGPFADNDLLSSIGCF